MRGSTCACASLSWARARGRGWAGAAGGGVYSVGGRRVPTLHRCEAGSEALLLVWDGCDAGGEAVLLTLPEQPRRDLREYRSRYGTRGNDKRAWTLVPQPGGIALQFALER